MSDEQGWPEPPTGGYKTRRARQLAMESWNDAELLAAAAHHERMANETGMIAVEYAARNVVEDALDVLHSRNR